MKIEPTEIKKMVNFENDRLELWELDSDDDILTSLQIRFEKEKVLIFVSDYDRELKHAKMSYKEFKEKIIEMIS